MSVEIGLAGESSTVPESAREWRVGYDAYDEYDLVGLFSRPLNFPLKRGLLEVDVSSSGVGDLPLSDNDRARGVGETMSVYEGKSPASSSPPSAPKAGSISTARLRRRCRRFHQQNNETLDKMAMAAAPPAAPPAIAAVLNRHERLQASAKSEVSRCVMC